jgi:hypothetical protein
MSECGIAAAHGDLEALRQAHRDGCEWGPDTCANAALGGHLQCLVYSLEHGCPSDWRTCTFAAHQGHFACLKYAHEHGCDWDADTCMLAACNGHLDCLVYAHERGCPLHDVTTWCAARNGHVDCLQYAHEHGCAWDKNTQGKTAEVVRYAHHLGKRLAREEMRRVVRRILLPKWRDAFHLRRIAFYWYDQAGRRTYAPGGPGRKRDREAFVAECLA